MLAINQTSFNKYSAPLLNNNNSIKTKPYPNDSVQFRGRVGHEVVRYGKKSLTLIQETAFFREPNTLNKVINYVNKQFGSEPKINIIVGACSSGEEALSYRMLMRNKKCEILGFDVGKDAIKKAREHIYQISAPKDAKNAKFADDLGISAYKDSYLGFSRKRTSDTQRKHKELFNKYFEEIETPKEKVGFMTRFRNFLIEKVGRVPDVEITSKTYKLRHPEKLNCKFILGDIKNMDEFVPEGKAHVVSFRNAFYHIMNEDLEQFERTPIPEKKLRPVLTDIAKQVNKALKKDGLFVLGEKEDLQGSNMELLSDVLKETGFREYSESPDGYCNIWRKYKDITE